MTRGPPASSSTPTYVGGWLPLPGLSLEDNHTLCYPGDPPLPPLFLLLLRTEMILVYPHGFVAVVQPDGSFEAARMD
jgi:hypothetical protein